MAYKTVESQQTVNAVDIPTMSEMSLDDYHQYLRGGLLFVDHHDILRSEPAGYPLAVNREQLKALIAYLKELMPKMAS